MQVLYRAEAHSGDDSARLRLTLRRWAAERFDLRATDAFGRGAWALAVDGELAVWSDLRESQRCRLPAARRVRFGSVSLPLPSLALPAVLAGVLPEPAHRGESATASGDVPRRESESPEARRWVVHRDGEGRLIAWELVVDGAVRLAWEAEEGRRRLRSEEPAFDVEWREVAREPLAAAPPDLQREALALSPCPDAHLS